MKKTYDNIWSFYDGDDLVDRQPMQPVEKASMIVKIKDNKHPMYTLLYSACSNSCMDKENEGWNMVDIELHCIAFRYIFRFAEDSSGRRTLEIRKIYSISI